MGINNAENDIKYALENKIADLRRDLDEFKARPQPIGNGSINYAVFGSGSTFGPISVPSNGVYTLSVLYMDNSVPLTYDALPAINRHTLFDLLVSVYVDSQSVNNRFPSGSALSSGQKGLIVSTWCDVDLSGIYPNNGQRLMNIQLANRDSAAHNYWINANALIPRPALKPQ